MDIREGRRVGSGAQAEAITPEEFSVRVNTFSPEAQELVAGYSSLHLETDVWARIKASAQELEGIQRELSGAGVKPDDVELVFRYFDLPRPLGINPNGSN